MLFSNTSSQLRAHCRHALITWCLGLYRFFRWPNTAIAPHHPPISGNRIQGPTILAKGTSICRTHEVSFVAYLTNDLLYFLCLSENSGLRVPYIAGSGTENRRGIMCGFGREGCFPDNAVPHGFPIYSLAQYRNGERRVPHERTVTETGMPCEGGM